MLLFFYLQKNVQVSGNQIVKPDSLTRDFPHNIFRISHDSKHGVINHI